MAPGRVVSSTYVARYHLPGRLQYRQLLAHSPRGPGWGGVWREEIIALLLVLPRSRRVKTGVRQRSVLPLQTSLVHTCCWCSLRRRTAFALSRISFLPQAL